MLRQLSSLLFVASALASGIKARSGRCNTGQCADACALDLFNNPDGPASVSSLCSAFYQDVWVTANPETTWVTTVVATDVVTVTSTTVSKVYSVVPKRDLQQRVPIASTSPSWAPHCNGDDKYSSACSCFGASPATLTQTPDAVTSYVSATATVTTVVAPPPAACAGNDNSPYVQCCGSFSDGYLGSNCQTPPQTDAESAQNFCSALGESTYCCASQASSLDDSLLCAIYFLNYDTY